MHTTLARLVLVPVTLVTAVVAQTFTSPRGFDTTEGAGYSYYMGALAEGRHVIMDGEHRTRAFTIKEVAFRADHLTYSSNAATARRWSNVQLQMAECDIAAQKRVFTQIATTTPTLVFSASVAWPTIIGTPRTTPAPWLYRYPFRTSWAYSGRQDILFDWNFSGGVLANNASWSTTIRYYRLDGSHGTFPYAIGATKRFGVAGPGVGCLDQGSMATHGAFTNLAAHTYGPNYTTTSYRNRTQLQMYSLQTAPNRPVAYALGVAGGTGLTFPGVACNKLYVDTTKPTFFYFTTTLPRRDAYARIHFALVPFQRSTVGFKLYAQGGWSDSGTGAFKLTRASSITLPGLPAPLPNRQALFATRASQTSGSGPFLYFYMLPVVRLTN